MHSSESNILPYAGIVIIIIFLAMSYFNNHIFLDKILVCSFILILVFLLKIASTPKSSSSHSEKRRIQ